MTGASTTLRLAERAVAMTATIALSRIHFPVTTLGAGPKDRSLVSGMLDPLSGMHFDGYVGTGPRNHDHRRSRQRHLPNGCPTADGITISGGEPFDQPDALFELLARIRSQTEADILVFTGYPWTKVSGMLTASPA